MLANVNTKKDPRPANYDNYRSNTAVAGGRGRPFRKGEDPRRHKLGRVSLSRSSLFAKFSEALGGEAGDPAELARILWKYARVGRPWAVTEILNRICGKPTPPQENSESQFCRFSLAEYKKSMRRLEDKDR